MYTPTASCALKTKNLHNLMNIYMWPGDEFPEPGKGILLVTSREVNCRLCCTNRGAELLGTVSASPLGCH